MQLDPELLENARSISEAIRRLRYRQTFVHPGIPYGVLPTSSRPVYGSDC